MNPNRLRLVGLLLHYSSNARDKYPLRAKFGVWVSGGARVEVLEGVVPLPVPPPVVPRPAKGSASGVQLSTLKKMRIVLMFIFFLILLIHSFHRDGVEDDACRKDTLEES